MRCDLFRLLSILTLLGLYGCDMSPEPERLQPQIKLLLAPALAHQLSLRTITITVGEEMMHKDAQDLSEQERETRSVPFDIELTLGELTRIGVGISYEDSSAPARDEKTVIMTRDSSIDEGLLALAGDEKTVIMTRERNVVYFSLDPPGQPAMGIDSNQAFPVSVDKEFTIYIYIRNVQDLFGAAVRLQFDEDAISPQDVLPGRFWGEKDEFIWINDSKLQRKPNELNIAWTRLREPLLDESGEQKELATVKFMATASKQDAMIMIEILQLKNQNGEDVLGEEEERLKDTLRTRVFKFDIR